MSGVTRTGPIGEVQKRAFPCARCRHFETGDAVANHYVARRDAAMKKLPPIIRLADQGKAQAENARFKVFDVMLRSGSLGMCLIGKSETDFCHASYGRATERLAGCNHWEGRSE